MFAAHKFKSNLIEAGFEDIREEILEVPWGGWPKNQRLKAIGMWHLGKAKTDIVTVIAADMNRTTYDGTSRYCYGLADQNVGMEPRRSRGLPRGFEKGVERQEPSSA